MGNRVYCTLPRNANAACELHPPDTYILPMIWVSYRIFLGASSLMNFETCRSFINTQYILQLKISLGSPLGLKSFVWCACESLGTSCCNWYILHQHILHVFHCSFACILYYTYVMMENHKSFICCYGQTYVYIKTALYSGRTPAMQTPLGPTHCPD